MTLFLAILLFAVMAGILVILGLGMVGMARGNDPRRSNRLMRWRVTLQGLALVLFALLLLFRN